MSTDDHIPLKDTTDNGPTQVEPTPEEIKAFMEKVEKYTKRYFTLTHTIAKKEGVDINHVLVPAMAMTLGSFVVNSAALSVAANSKKIADIPDAVTEWLHKFVSQLQEQTDGYMKKLAETQMQLDPEFAKTGVPSNDEAASAPTPDSPSSGNEGGSSTDGDNHDVH